MLIALLIIILAQGYDIVEYRFGMNYGSIFFDFSLNNRHGQAFNSSSLITTTRGLHFNQNSNSIKVPSEGFPKEFSSFLWVLLKSSFGLIYSINFLQNSHFLLVFNYPNFEVRTNDLGKPSKSWKIPNYLNISHWNLIKVHLKDNNFKVSLSDHKFNSFSVIVTGISSISIGGNSNIHSVEMFLWSFFIQSGDVDSQNFISEEDYNQCLTFDCEPCVNDQFYGNICLSTENFTGLNESIVKSSCLCQYYCLLNIYLDSYACMSKSGEVTSGQVCKSGLFFRSFNCCPGDCFSCSNLGKCEDCIDPLAEVTSQGRCKCREGYFGTPSNFSITNCSKCSSGCISCNSTSTCFLCSSLFEKSKNTCKCNPGFYLNPSNESSCLSCPESCKTCTRQICLSCQDPNSTPSENSCKCKAGYYLPKDSKNCSKCSLLCQECLDFSNCLKCSDPEARLSNGNCICRDQFFLLGKEKCSPCNEDCQKCENNLTCLSCKSSNSLLTPLGCTCIEGFYNTSKLLYINSCKPCPVKCLGCKNDGKCSSCTGNFTRLVNFKCSCFPGFYDPGENEPDCKKCLNFKESETCKLECDSGSVWVVDKCVSCSEFCLFCDQNLYCYSCQSEFRVFNGKCECFKGQKLKGKTCSPSYFRCDLEVKQNNSIFIKFSERLEKFINWSMVSVIIELKEHNVTVINLSDSEYMIEISTFKSNKNTSIPFTLNLQNPIYSLNNSELDHYSYSSWFHPQGPSSFAKMIKSTTQSALIASFASAMVSNPAACWILINTIQFLSFLPLSAVNYSQDIIEFIQAIGGYSFIPNWIALFFDQDSSGEPSPRASLLGIKSSVFWVNFGASLLVLMAYLALIPFIVVGKQFKVTYGTCREWLKNYRFNLFIRFWIEIYLEIGIFALIQIEATSGKEKVVYFNYLTASIVMIIICCTPGYSLLLMYLFRNRLEDFEIIEKYGTFFTEFKVERGVNGCLFYPIYFTRRLQYMLTQIFLVNFPELQLFLNLFGSFGQFAYLITFKPFKEKTVFFAEFVGEVVILLVLIFSVLIFKSESCANSKILSNFFIFSVLFTLGVQTFISFYSLLVTLKKAYMKLKIMKLMKEVKNMNKIHPEVPCQTINDTDNSNINDPL